MVSTGGFLVGAGRSPGFHRGLSMHGHTHASRERERADRQHHGVCLQRKKWTPEKTGRHMSVLMYTNNMLREYGNSEIHAEPLAFFLTWTTYASWIPGDERGWCDRHGCFRSPSPGLRESIQQRLPTQPVILTPGQRKLVQQAITDHCEFRRWKILALSCQSNHVHVVVSAQGNTPANVLRSIKAWASRQLSETTTEERKWWTRGGSKRQIFTHDSLERVVQYVAEFQDHKRFRNTL